jgi:hypothetical protein
MKDPYIHEKYTRERSAARKLAQEYFERFPKDRYQTVRCAELPFGGNPKGPSATWNRSARATASW